MINIDLIKLKIFKSTLSLDESRMFDLIDAKYSEKPFKFKRKLYYKFKDKKYILWRIIGEIYLDKEARYIFLTNEELQLIENGISNIRKMRNLEMLAKEKGYNVYINCKEMYRILMRSSNLYILKCNLRLIEWELDFIKMQVRHYDDLANSKYIPWSRDKIDTLSVDCLDCRCKSFLRAIKIDINNKKDISLSEIKKNYRKTAHSLHPDKNNNISDSKIKDLNTSYEYVKSLFYK